jgi:hypothetical protein
MKSRGTLMTHLFGSVEGFALCLRHADAAPRQSLREMTLLCDLRARHWKQGNTMRIGKTEHFRLCAMARRGGWDENTNEENSYAAA